MPAPLAAAGFDPGALTVFVAEGLSWYLPGQAVALLPDQAAGIAAPGSRLGVAMVSADCLANPAAAPYFELAAAGPKEGRIRAGQPRTDEDLQPASYLVYSYRSSSRRRAACM